MRGALIALATAQQMLLDAAVVLALVSFLGTAAYMLMFRRHGRTPETAGRDDGGESAS